MIALYIFSLSYLVKIMYEMQIMSYGIFVFDDIDIEAQVNDELNEEKYETYFIENTAFMADARKKIHENSKFFASYNDLIKDVNRLKHDNELRNTLLGIRPNMQMIESAITIQAGVRGWILRCDKRIFDHCVHVFLSRCRIMIQSKKFKRLKTCALKLQAIFRGNSVRKSPAGKAVKLLKKFTTIQF